MKDKKIIIPMLLIVFAYMYITNKKINEFNEILDQQSRVIGQTTYELLKSANPKINYEKKHEGVE